MKLKRISAGHYESEDLRVEITKQISRSTRESDEICWTLRIDGAWKGDLETKRDCVDKAERLLRLNPAIGFVDLLQAENARGK